MLPLAYTPLLAASHGEPGVCWGTSQERALVVAFALTTKPALPLREGRAKRWGLELKRASGV